MDILLQNLLRGFWLDVTPFLDWAVANWAVTLGALALALVWSSRYRTKSHR